MTERMTSETRRSGILDAAVSILAEDGPEALTAARLTHEAGVSRGNLFHHFATLDDVVLAAFERSVEQMESVTGAPPATLREWLLAVGADASAFAEERRALLGATFAFLARARRDARLRERVESVLADAVTRFDDMLRTFGARDPSALAEFIAIAADGLAVHRHLFVDRSDRQTAAWHAFVDALTPPTSSAGGTS